MKLGFQSSAIAVRTADGRAFTLLEPLVYVSRSGERIVVEAGQSTDGASTPRLLWRTIPPFGPYWLAAVLHDFLYRSSTRPKEECDALFLEAMLLQGVSPALAHTIHRGVQWFGRAAFNEDRNPSA